MKTKGDVVTVTTLAGVSVTGHSSTNPPLILLNPLGDARSMSPSLILTSMSMKSEARSRVSSLAVAAVAPASRHNKTPVAIPDENPVKVAGIKVDPHNPSTVNMTVAATAPVTNSAGLSSTLVSATPLVSLVTWAHKNPCVAMTRVVASLARRVVSGTSTLTSVGMLAGLITAVADTPVPSTPLGTLCPGGTCIRNRSRPPLLLCPTRPFLVFVVTRRLSLN